MPILLAVSVRRAGGAVLVRLHDDGRLLHLASGRWESDAPRALAQLVGLAGSDALQGAVVSAADDDVRKTLAATVRTAAGVDPLTTTPKATRRSVVGRAQASDGDVDDVLVSAVEGLRAVESATIRDALLAVVWSQQQKRALELRDGTSGPPRGK
jgi:hypothetical protein